MSEHDGEIEAHVSDILVLVLIALFFIALMSICVIIIF